MTEEASTRDCWVRVLRETPILIRRRASAYLKNIQKTSKNEWLVWSDRETQYNVHLAKGQVTCTCPYSQQEKGYCKHICAVAAFELTRIDVMPWLKKLEGRL
ncbi:MAG: SWIM zinc finger protein [Candidatus Bathyarchaeota archaeon BA1]|nr:MAG: SWIM zinc finger protein [Candidatus Bathyarchaeota archaeon BA1]